MSINFATANLTPEAHTEFATFLTENVTNFDPTRLPVFIEALGDCEGYFEISKFYSVTGNPATIDLRDPENWVA